MSAELAYLVARVEELRAESRRSFEEAADELRAQAFRTPDGWVGDTIRRVFERLRGQAEQVGLSPSDR